MDMASETAAMTRRRIWGQVLVFSAHGGRLLRAGRCFVALNMEKVAASNGDNDETAAEVDTAQEELCYSNSELDFLNNG